MSYHRSTVAGPCSRQEERSRRRATCLRLWKSFARNRSAATAIEFAIIVVPFLMFVLLIFQIALYYFGLQSLDYAARLAARQIMLGDAGSGSQSSSSFKNKFLCPNFLMGFDCGKVVLNATKVAPTARLGPGSSLSQFVDTAKLTLQPVSSGSFCIGGPGDYVFLDISYSFPNFLGSFFASTGLTSNTFQLRSTNFFRNEPYKGAGGGC